MDLNDDVLGVIISHLKLSDVYRFARASKKLLTYVTMRFNGWKRVYRNSFAWSRPLSLDLSLLTILSNVSIHAEETLARIETNETLQALLKFFDLYTIYSSPIILPSTLV